MLNEELDKLKALETYKKGFFSYISRYLINYLSITPKEAYRILRKAFGSWYFDGIRNGKIVNFFPITDIVRERDLKYLFTKLDKEYEPYKPFTFEFRIRKKYRPGLKIQKINNEEEQKIMFQLEDYKYSISLLQYGRLRDLYCGPPGYLDRNIMVLLLRYGFIGTKNNHLSVPPSLISANMIELFGSPLNTCSLNYCSPLNIDKIFGSKGSFFSYPLRSGCVYIANPPFIEDIMIEMSEKFLIALENVKNLTIYTVIPVWDEEAVARGMTYVAWDKLKISPHLKDHKILDQFSYPFLDYYDNKYIPVVDVHIAVHSNNSDFVSDLDDIADKWVMLKSKILN